MPGALEYLYVRFSEISPGDGSMTQPTLQPLPEDWNTALAVVAHPDDLEFGGAAAIAGWTAAGKHVSYCLITSGEAGIDGSPPDRTRLIREQEQRAAAAIVGVSDVEFLGFADGILEYNLPLRRAIAATIRKHQPEILITTNFRDTWGDGVLNQADHIATGRAIVDGVRDAANRWVHPELLADGLAPWNQVRQLWVAYSPLATHGVDVGATMDQGTASLLAHKEYLSGLDNPDFEPISFLRDLARTTGKKLGCEYAVEFEVINI
jgi:LmbE family N-acetylglucosaminyl deacetylase